MGLAIFEGADSDRDEVGAVAMGSPSPDGRQVGPLARAGAYVSLAGMSLGILGVLLPHPASFDVAALLAVQASTALFALSFLLLADRLPMWVVRAAPGLGIIQVSAGVVFSGDPVGAYATFYLWPCFYAFYFLSRKDGIWAIAILTATYAAAILLMAQLGRTAGLSVGDLTHQYVLTVGSLMIAGIMINQLRSRVNGLWTRLTAAARTDMLTGYLNEQGFNEALATEVERARPGSLRIAVLHARVSGIPGVNRKLGHVAGDGALQEVGHLLDESTRRIDQVGRTAATEFALVLPETDEHTGYLLAEQILARMRRTHQERADTVRLSLGVSSYPKHGVVAEELFLAASAASQVAASLGSDRAVVFSPDVENAVAAESGVSPNEGRVHLTTVLSLAEVLDLRDPRNASHSAAVARYCELLARELGLSDHQVHRLRLAGMLHDIGKVGIPDSILDKPGPLSPSEWDQVRRHPEMAARILGSNELADIRQWLLARHEQPDGHGYPRGLGADEIPIEASILAVAESFDAITSERPYRGAKDRVAAIAEIGRYVGSQFDGAVVDALVRVVHIPMSAQAR